MHSCPSDGYAANHYNTNLEPRDEPKPTAFFPPGYPLAIAAVWKAFGGGVTSAKLLNALLGAATIPFVFAMGRRLFGVAAGLSAAAVFALLPSGIAYVPVLLSEHLFTLLLAAALWTLACCPRRYASVAAFGAVFGLAVLTRGQGLVLLPAAALFWLQRDGWSRGVTSVGLALLVATLLILPWTVRNWIVMDYPIAVSSNAGMDARIGHGPAADGTFEFTSDPIDGVEMWRSSSRPDWEVRSYRVYVRRAVRYALLHPKQEIVLAKRKVEYLYRPEYQTISPMLTMDGASPWPSPFDRMAGPVIDVTWFVVLLVGLASAVACLRRGPEHALLVAVFACWMLFHVLSLGLPRFHLPLLPVLAVTAVGGPERLLELTRVSCARRRQRPGPLPLPAVPS